ncbi:MAG: hypothetical protein ACI9JE_000653, partial [Candidatus Krumholzibacteriia bacterium]
GTFLGHDAGCVDQRNNDQDGYSSCYIRHVVTPL